MKIIIWIGIFLGYFILRFGMVSRGRSREIIQFMGGVILTICFILSFLFSGLKAGFINILIFCVITTPITELIINKVQKRINLPYKNIHEYLAKKYNTTPEEIRPKTIYENKYYTQLKEQTESIFKLAHEFVAVRDQVNKTAGTFRSLFQKINFQDLYNSVLDIESKINEKAIVIQNFKSQTINITNTKEKCLPCLIDYIWALKEAAHILTQKMNLLTQRAQDKRSLKWSEFDTICKDERMALEKCQSTGNILTNLYSKL